MLSDSTLCLSKDEAGNMDYGKVYIEMGNMV